MNLKQMAIFIIFPLAFCLSSQAASFSALAQNGTLYVSVLTDDCNQYVPHLEITTECHYNRTRECRPHDLKMAGKLTFLQSRLPCSGMKASLFALDISSIPKRFQTLDLTLDEETIVVELPEQTTN